jgi:hypothetical protein
MRLFRAILLLTACALPVLASAEEKLGKIDRMRIVGTPVLDQAPRGLHVWLEDGWYRIAAVSALPVGGTKKLRRDFAVTVHSTKSIDKVELHTWKKSSGGGEHLVMRVETGPDPEIMRFKTEGDITIRDATVEGEPAQIYLGPTSKLAASVVRVGRY